MSRALFLLLAGSFTLAQANVACPDKPQAIADPAQFSAIKFDYLVVGGGTAGVALSARLSENPLLVVGLIEAGTTHFDNPIIDAPENSPGGNPEFDWMFASTPQVHANGQTVALPRGKLLGGSSGINGLAWGRGSTPEYDAWNSFAPGHGWTWDGLLPFMKKAENFDVNPPNPYPGISPAAARKAQKDLPRVDGFWGPVNAAHTSFYFDTVPNLVKSLNALGIPTNAEPQGGNATGVTNTLLSVDPRRGARSYSAIVLPRLGLSATSRASQATWQPRRVIRVADGSLLAGLGAARLGYGSKSGEPSQNGRHLDGRPATMPPRNPEPAIVRPSAPSKNQPPKTPQKSPKKRKQTAKHVEFDTGAIMTQWRISGEEQPQTKRQTRAGAQQAQLDANEEHVRAAASAPIHHPQRQDLTDPASPTNQLAEREYFDVYAVGNSDSEQSGPPSPTPAAGPSQGRGLAFPTPQPPATPARRPTGPANTPVAGRRQKAAPRGPAGSRVGKQAQDVWLFVQENEKTGRKDCKFCLLLQAQNSKHNVTSWAGASTDNYRKHFCDNHIDEWVPACDAAGIAIKAKGVSTRVHAWRKAQGQAPADPVQHDAQRPEFDREVFIDYITEWIVTDDQPLSVVENPQLRKIFLLLRSELQEKDIPGRTTIRNRIIEVFEEYLDELKEQIKRAPGKISFTMDLWSDPNLLPYMAVTAHWLQLVIEETPTGPKPSFQLRADLIGFHRVPTRHTGPHLATAFLHLTDRVSASHKIGWITMDNASNNDTCMEAIEESLQARGIPFDASQRRIRCFPHVVNLACQSVLNALTKMEWAAEDSTDFVPKQFKPKTLLEAIKRDPVATLRSLIRGIRASSLRRQCFADIQHNEGDAVLQLLRDVETRWSSTYLMIDRALDLRKAIEKFLKDSEFSDMRKYSLHAIEWTALELFHDVLAVPHMFQQLLSSESTPTIINTLVAYKALERKWKELIEKKPVVQGIVQHGLDKLSEYEEHNRASDAYTLATIVNPRHKHTWFEKNATRAEAQAAKALFLQEMYKYRSSMAAKPAQSAPRRAPTATQRAYTSLLDDDDDDEDNSEQPASDLPTVEAEWAMYNAEARDKTIDPLVYWMAMRARYPTIYAIAVDVLPIQASAVPCERVFSSGKMTVTDRRNRIGAILMEALQVLKFRFKKGRALVFTEGLGKEDETKDLESRAEDIPEDLRSFTQLLH